jgi:predicted RNA binding protein YcfA (HicA-like mRNA interferase family)
VSPKLKHLSGAELISIFESFGFKIQGQKGSHIKLRREINNTRQTLTIPLHNELDTGTLKAVIRQASKYISESELHAHFYSQ